MLSNIETSVADEHIPKTDKGIITYTDDTNTHAPSLELSKCKSISRVYPHSPLPTVLESLHLHLTLLLPLVLSLQFNLQIIICVCMIYILMTKYQILSNKC